MPAHDGTLMCIGAHSCSEIVKNDFLTILICWIYVSYRIPIGYPQRSCDVKSSVASYPSSGQIFGTFEDDALAFIHILFRCVDLLLDRKATLFSHLKNRWRGGRPAIFLPEQVEVLAHGVSWRILFSRSLQILALPRLLEREIFHLMDRR